jgi:hypothetical protein
MRCYQLSWWCAGERLRRGPAHIRAAVGALDTFVRPRLGLPGGQEALCVPWPRHRGGRTLWTGAFRPGRMHDQTAVKTEGICDLFERYPKVKAKVDAGYQGLAKQYPDQVQAPPPKPKKDVLPEEVAAWDAISSPRNGSASSTPTPNTSSGGSSSGTSDVASTSTRPTRQWLAWFPTAPPRGDHQADNPPGQHARTSIVHNLVTRLNCEQHGFLVELW